MSSPLPTELAAIERLLDQSVAAPSAQLRARVLAAAEAPAKLGRPRREPRTWLAASIAAGVLLFFNLVRSASLSAPPSSAPRAIAICTARASNDERAPADLSPALRRLCQTLQLSPVEE